MYNYYATLDRVVDGDTIDVTIDLGFSIYIKRRVRLQGINTPEVRTRDLEEKERGLAASNRVVELLESFGEKFIIRTTLVGSDKYGRVLGVIVSREGINLNDTLLEEGHAVPY